jgi:hypothetical protein
MTIAIMQPYFFPYIGYFQLVNSVDKFIIYDDVNFIKQGWIARNRIILQGKEHYVILQLNGASSFKKINEIQIGTNADKLLKTIYQAYNKAPFFPSSFPIIEKIIKVNIKNLADFLINQLIILTSYLGISTELLISSSINKNNNLKGSKKIIHICNILGATKYINSIGGSELYNKEDFQNSGINLYFLKSKPIKYKQFGDIFFSNLSIIDVMMFNDVPTIKNYLNQYELI